MLLALFLARTVNLREIAIYFQSTAQIDSRYKRCKRFFAQFSIDFDTLARWAFQLYSFETRKYYLTIDRTNWFRGKSKINILTLGIAHEGAAISVLWRLLDKAGNATAAEHQEIIAHFTQLFGKKGIVGVLADRKFASGALFRWLNKQKIPFYIRIKEGSSLKIRKTKICSAEQFFHDLRPKTQKIYDMAIELYGQKVYVAGSRSEKGELMIVATNRDPRNAIYSYLRRWEIETLFGCLKSKGFRFEETHMTNQERLSKLMALLVVGFCWAHKIGECRAIQNPIQWNQYSDSRRPQFSYFRYGLDQIRSILANIITQFEQFLLILVQLLPHKTATPP